MSQCSLPKACVGRPFAVPLQSWFRSSQSQCTARFACAPRTCDTGYTLGPLSSPNSVNLLAIPRGRVTIGHGAVWAEQDEDRALFIRAGWSPSNLHR
jgi:hypothetical protein